MSDYKAQSERTDENERLLTPPFRRTPAPQPRYEVEWKQALMALRLEVAREIADEIERIVNAALAAEERRANDSIEENVRLMNRLAAEREKVKVLVEALIGSAR